MWKASGVESEWKRSASRTDSERDVLVDLLHLHSNLKNSLKLGVPNQSKAPAADVHSKEEIFPDPAKSKKQFWCRCSLLLPCVVFCCHAFYCMFSASCFPARRKKTSFQGPGIYYTL